MQIASVFRNIASSISGLGVASISVLAAADEGAQPYRHEIGFLNSFLTSQEYMRHFFSDYDSSVHPVPAYLYVLYAESNLPNSLSLVTSFSIPTSAEVVTFKRREPFVYHYPKTFNLLANYSLFAFQLTEKTPVEFRVGAGLNVPLSHRFGATMFPVFGSDFRLAVSSSAGIHLGFGYVGNVSRGVWMIPFGFGYRI